ncbi:hypothetical protein EYR41_008010 [Orbilia oligospora]|uniref:Uncharacterized protein n=1 Tax=Orbilia oligospora TaxID=2813651 RepID=A0A8H2DTC1_ORBOL|nr:hypothetical protein TWF132_003117 [Orbilia oligospora]TGJ66367.1 hypothetical protein EYR41_008010 [Orbilia oligospora]
MTRTRTRHDTVYDDEDDENDDDDDDDDDEDDDDDRLERRNRWFRLWVYQEKQLHAHKWKQASKQADEQGQAKRDKADRRNDLQTRV